VTACAATVFYEKPRRNPDLRLRPRHFDRQKEGALRAALPGGVVFSTAEPLYTGPFPGRFCHAAPFDPPGSRPLRVDLGDFGVETNAALTPAFSRGERENWRHTAARGSVVRRIALADGDLENSGALAGAGGNS
jgi:hypothetical protein